MDYYSKRMWNSNSHVGPTRWLTDQRDEEAKARMTSMGNIVVPQQAFTAFCVLTHMARMANSVA
jgi:hypothetical protein